MAEFSQIMNVPRGQVSNAYFSVGFYDQKMMVTNDLEMFVAINNSIIYTRPFVLITQEPLTWQTTGNIYLNVWQNLTSLFKTMKASSTIVFSVGIKYANPISTQYSGFANMDRQVIFFNNIHLVLTTVANATQPDINLKVNGVPLISSTSAWGAASFSLTGAWTSSPITLTFTTTSPSIAFSATFVIQTQVVLDSSYAQTFSSLGTTFTASPAASTSWAFYENVYIPSGYQNYNLTVTKPKSWVINSVLDPTGTPLAFTKGLQNQATFSITTTTAGWFSVTAQSANALAVVNTSPDNATWTTGSTFTNQNTFYARTGFSPALSSVSGNASLLIQAPAGQTWYQTSTDTRSTTYTWFGKFTFGTTNSSGGTYNGFVAWENGTSAGISSFTVTDIHSTKCKSCIRAMLRRPTLRPNNWRQSSLSGSHSATRSRTFLSPGQRLPVRLTRPPW